MFYFTGNEKLRDHYKQSTDIDNDGVKNTYVLLIYLPFVSVARLGSKLFERPLRLC